MILGKEWKLFFYIFDIKRIKEFVGEYFDIYVSGYKLKGMVELIIDYFLYYLDMGIIIKV